jgi:hypothetical protein
MSGLVIELARWIARALHGVAARLEAWSTQRGIAQAATAPTIAFDGLSARFPGAPAHWLETIAEHLGDEATALPIEQDGIETSVEPSTPTRSAGSAREIDAGPHIRKARPTLVFANGKSRPQIAAGPGAIGRAKGRTSFAFTSPGAKPRPSSAPSRRSMREAVRLLLIPGGRAANPVSEQPAAPARPRPDVASYPATPTATAPEQASERAPAKRPMARFPQREAHCQPAAKPPPQEAAPRSSNVSLPAWESSPRPAIEFPHGATRRAPAIHVSQPALSRHASPVGIVESASRWPTLPSSDATIADATPSFPTGRDDRHEQMVGRWSA